MGSCFSHGRYSRDKRTIRKRQFDFLKCLYPNYSEFWRKKRNYQSLFEYAVLLYNSKKRAEDKEASRPLIEIVIQHGDKPSPKFQGNIAWPILGLLVKYVNNSTHYGGDVRQQLWEYRRTEGC